MGDDCFYTLERLWVNQDNDDLDWGALEPVQRWPPLRIVARNLQTADTIYSEVLPQFQGTLSPENWYLISLKSQEYLAMQPWCVHTHNNQPYKLFILEGNTGKSIQEIELRESGAKPNQIIARPHTNTFAVLRSSERMAYLEEFILDESTGKFKKYKSDTVWWNHLSMPHCLNAVWPWPMRVSGRDEGIWMMMLPRTQGEFCKECQEKSSAGRLECGRTGHAGANIYQGYLCCAEEVGMPITLRPRRERERRRFLQLEEPVDHRTTVKFLNESRIEIVNRQANVFYILNFAPLW